MSTENTQARAWTIEDADDAAMMLEHVLATLDLATTVANSGDPAADVETLCKSTLSNALYGLQRQVETVLAWLMYGARDAQQKLSAARCAPAARGYSDATRDRIEAFLESMARRPGLGDREWQEGRDLIVKLARSADGEDAPGLKLSPSESAVVLRVLRYMEPVEPAIWWDDDRDDRPSHVCGFNFILGALGDSRTSGEAS